MVLRPTVHSGQTLTVPSLQPLPISLSALISPPRLHLSPSLHLSLSRSVEVCQVASGEDAACVVPERHEQRAPRDDQARRGGDAGGGALLEHQGRERDVGDELDAADRRQQRLGRVAFFCFGVVVVVVVVVVVFSRIDTGRSGLSVCAALLPSPRHATSQHSQNTTETTPNNAPNETKLATLPTANAATPACHSRKRRTGGLALSGPGSAARRLCPSFITFCLRGWLVGRVRWDGCV